MKNRLSYHERKKLFRSAWIIIVATIAWLLFAPWGIIRYYRLQKQLTETSALNKELKQSNKNLREEIERLKKDPEYIEQVARKEYGLIKKNEVIYQFPKRKRE